MFCVIYKFKVIAGKEDQFIESWGKVTNAFKKHCDALGSRSHKSENGEYIAYAQWPSKESWDKAELPHDIINSDYAKMKSCSLSTEVLFELTPVSDLLTHTTSD